MLAQFEHIRRRHHGESGRRREDDVREFLEAFLPARLAVGTGEIAATDGQVSPQVDLIVYDRQETPLLDRSESSIVVPAEGVYGVVEVSSNLDTAKLREDTEKIRAVKRLPKTAYVEGGQRPIEWTTRLWGREHAYFPIVGFCFAYNSVGLETLWQELCNIDISTTALTSATTLT
jgi:hypothetical protein